MPRLAVLFICVGNSCRSPMAEAITRGLAAGRVTAASAGLAPLGRIVAPTMHALEVLGYDSRGLSSKGLDEVDLDSFDVIVSLLGPGGLTYLQSGLGAQLEAWSIPDPYGEDDEVYLSVARDLEGRIRELLADQSSRELPVA